jgi:hypothetical protein
MKETRRVIFFPVKLTIWVPQFFARMFREYFATTVPQTTRTFARIYSTSSINEERTSEDIARSLERFKTLAILKATRAFNAWFCQA